MCALEFRCRFEKAMTTPSLGITILVVQKKERATGSHSVTFLQPALSGLFTDEVIDQTAVAESLSFINSNEWIAYTSAHLFPVRPPYLILFYFFLLLCICFVCTRLYFSAGRKGKEEEKKIKHKRPDGCTCFPTTDKEGETSVSIRAPYRLATAA